MRFKFPPFQHQVDDLALMEGKRAAALCNDMGTGKTKSIIDDAARVFLEGGIDTLVVVAPNGVQRNWTSLEIPMHMSPDVAYKLAVYTGSNGKVAERRAWADAERHGFDGLTVFAFNKEALSSVKGKKVLKALCEKRKVYLVLDESQYFKTPGAKCTQTALVCGRRAAYRRILSGSPAPKGPMDLYAQYKFLDPNILGHSTYTGFKARYAIVKRTLKRDGAIKIKAHCTKWNNPVPRTRDVTVAQLNAAHLVPGRDYFEEITGYKNIPELKARIRPYTRRVMKKDCIDLPDKIYAKRYVELTAQQRRMYREIIDEGLSAVFKTEDMLDQDPDTLFWNLLTDPTTPAVVASQAMVKYIRAQQIIGGFAVDSDNRMHTLEENPRLDAAMEITQETRHKIIIWAKFRHEVNLIYHQYCAEFGADAAVLYMGGMESDDKQESINRFQTDPTCRVFLATIDSGAEGLTLTAANTVIYYSNTFNAAKRWQSEDRAHRIGQKHNVTYIDLVARGTIDERLIKVLQERKEMAEELFDFRTIGD